MASHLLSLFWIQLGNPTLCSDKGCFFKSHKDTPRSEDMIASLVIVFPTAHEGGSLILRQGEKELDFNSGQELSGSESKVAYVAFFSDTDHEVTEVTSGHRVTLTYNLYISGSEAAAVQAKHAQQDGELLTALQKVLDSSETSGLRLGFGLQHQYAFSNSHLYQFDLSESCGLCLRVLILIVSARQPERK